MKFCLFLLIAGVLDALLTHFGMVSGVVEEGNPLMKFVIEQNWSYFYLIKIVLPLVLIGICYLRPFKGGIKVLLASACALYFTVLVYHMMWILPYLSA